MTDKKRYYGLDEIGFVGTQTKLTSEEARKETAAIVKFIKARKAKKIVVNTAKRK